MKEEYQDRIDSYVQNRMTEEDRILFEQEINADEDLREQLEFTQQVKQAVNSRTEKLRMLQEWMAEYDEEERKASVAAFRATGTDNYISHNAVPAQESQPQPSSRRKLWIWMSGIAAVLVVGLFVISPLYVFEDEGNVRDSGGLIFDTGVNESSPNGYSPSFKGKPTKQSHEEQDSIRNDSVTKKMKKFYEND